MGHAYCRAHVSHAVRGRTFSGMDTPLTPSAPSRSITLLSSFFRSTVILAPPSTTAYILPVGVVFWVGLLFQNPSKVSLVKLLFVIRQTLVFRVLRRVSTRTRHTRYFQFR